MWFVFPQLRGLGRSGTARLYGIDGLAEARAYLAHPVLGPRLEQTARAMLCHRGQRAEVILGAVDAMKRRSSATLFDAAGGGHVFADLLDAFHDGAHCPLTVAALEQ